METSDLTGGRLSEAVRAASRDVPPESLLPLTERDAICRLLLVEPVCVAFAGPGAGKGAQLRLGSAGEPVRLVEAPALRVPVAPLYASREAMVEGARERGWWPDGVEHAAAFAPGEVFARLGGHPGVLVVADRAHSVALDAGDLSALLSGKAPAEYDEGLRALVAKGRPREAVRTLAPRTLYVLGHPHGGMLMFQRELPVFLHLANAEAFARRLEEQTGERPQHGLVGARDLFRKAWAGKLAVRVDPGPRTFLLRPRDLR